MTKCNNILHLISIQPLKKLIFCHLSQYGIIRDHHCKCNKPGTENYVPENLGHINSLKS